jgi:hypothetical protein
MKLFLRRILFFCLLIAAFFAALEAFVIYYPSMFNLKASYIKKNNDIELLMLGSSHVQDDLNPAYFDMKSANLAYGSQDIELNSALFFKYIKNLIKLKYLLLEVDYHTLEEKNPEDYFRLPWYYKYHGIELGKTSFLNKNLLYTSSPEFFKNFLIQTINPFEYKYKLNQYGSVENDFPGIFMTLKYDKDKINITAGERLRNKFSDESIENYLFNTKKINAIINYCTSHYIKVILVKTPAYITYRNSFNAEKLKRRNTYIDSLIRSDQKEAFLLDHESDDRFQVTDFKNDDHLNSRGAKKFTEIINEEIKEIN